MYDPRYPSTPPLGIPVNTQSVPIVMVFDGVLGKEVSMPLVDGNTAVAKFPARFSYVIPNPYGNDNPLPPTGLPDANVVPIFGPILIGDSDTNIQQAVQIFPWELTVVFDNVLLKSRILFQIDAIFATHFYPARFVYVSGAPVPPVPFVPPSGPATPTDQLVVETVL